VSFNENMPEIKQSRKKEKKAPQQQKQREVVHPHAGKILFSWSAYEYEYYEKSTDWYWWVGFFALVLLGFALWQRSFLFVLVILLGWFAIALYAVRPPQMLSFSIAERGVLIGDHLYPWHDLRSFWIFYNPPLRKELVIAPKKTLLSALKINLGNIDPSALHDILVTFLPEIEEEDSLIDNLSRLVRF